MKTPDGSRLLEKRDCLPCPKCGSTDLDIFANMVICLEDDCDAEGPAQEGPEFLCDWRRAIQDWNEWASSLA